MGDLSRFPVSSTVSADVRRRNSRLILGVVLGLLFSAVPAVPALGWDGFVDLSGEPGGYVETLDSSALDITGDIDIRILVKLDEPTVVNWEGLVSKGNSGDLSYTSWGLFKKVDGTDPSRMLFEWRNASGTRLTKTSLTGLIVAGPRWYRVTLDVNNGSGGHTVTFWYSNDPVSTAPGSVGWTQHSQHTSSGVTSVRSSGADVWIGDMPVQDDPLDGQVYYAEIRNGIGGSVVANPDFRDTDQLLSTDPDFGVWEDDYGNRWTVYQRVVEPTVGYVELTETVGDYVSAPDASWLDVTGDFDLRVLVEFAEPMTIQWEGFASKGNSGGQSTASWGFFKRFIAADPSTAQIEWRNSAGTRLVRVSDTSYIHPGIRWYRVTLDVNNGAGGHTVSFWFSDDPPETDPASVVWTLKNQVTTAGTTNIRASTAAMWLGDMPSQGDPLNGRLFYAELRNGIDGIIVANPDFRTTDQLTSTPPNYSGWQDTTHNNPWTITGTGWTYTPPDQTPPQVILDYPAEGATVFHTETLTATASDDQGIDRVEFLVDDVVVATDTEAPYEASWDTTTQTDGAHTVTARAFDTSDNATDDDATVTVLNALSGTLRLLADYESEMLTVDEYTEMGIWSIHNLDLLPSRYAAGGEFAGDEATGAGLELLSMWDQLQPATQDSIDQFMTIEEFSVDTTTGAVPSIGSLYFSGGSVARLIYQAGGGNPDCDTTSSIVVIPVVLAKAFRCKRVIESLQGNPLIEVYYTATGLDDPSLLNRLRAQHPLATVTRWAEPTTAADIDAMTASLAESFETYANDLDYTVDPLPLRVAVHNTRPKVLPGGGNPLVQLDNDQATSYVPRHELFHRFQYEFVPAPAESLAVNWWMEATAEWAAHQVAVRRGLTGQTTNYAVNLPRYLDEPFGRIDAWDGYGGFEQYGAFILAEFLEEVDSDELDTIIKQTWEHIDELGGDQLDAIGLALDEHQTTWATQLPRFHVANYLLTSADAGWPYIDFHANTVWRNAIDTGPTGGDPETGDPLGQRLNELGLQVPRPTHEKVRLEADGTDGGHATVAGGGAYYVDMVPIPDDPGYLDIEVEVTPDPLGFTDILLQVLSFTAYPSLCELPSEIPLVSNGEGGLIGRALVPIEDPDCTFATLVISNPRPTETAPRVDWQVTYRDEALSGTTNLEFELGDLTFWDTFDSGDGEIGVDPYFEVVDDATTGSDPYAAHVVIVNGYGEDGLIRTVIPGDYYSTVGVNVSGTPGALAILEVTDDDGNTLRDTEVLSGIGYQELEVFIGFEEFVTIKLIADRNAVIGTVNVAFHGVEIWVDV